MQMIGEDSSKEISLYFHIPFCTKKCHYCHFYVLPDKEPLHQLLMKGLFLELEKWAPQLANKNLVSIYFGGGTPSLLHPDLIHQLIEKVRAYIAFDANSIEITLEANPETISIERMSAYKAAGINRISVGIQTLDTHLLKKLGRQHAASIILNGIESTIAAGIENISVDLMYDIPGQTLSSWEHTLKQSCQLPITHLSLYNLTIEPHTVFFKYQESLQKELPDADTSFKMFEMAVEMLDEAGLKQYEISAFARRDLYSKHNTGYWTARPFLGFGPSAFSYWNGERFRALANIHRYINALSAGENPYDFSEKLPNDKKNRELIAIALRMLQGINMDIFQAKNGVMDRDFWQSVLKLEEQGFINKSGAILSLTKLGRLFYDSVATEII